MIFNYDRMVEDYSQLLEQNVEKNVRQKQFERGL
jgi:hypothetical protein